MNGDFMKKIVTLLVLFFSANSFAECNFYELHNGERTENGGFISAKYSFSECVNAAVKYQLKTRISEIAVSDPSLKDATLVMTLKPKDPRADTASSGSNP